MSGPKVHPAPRGDGPQPFLDSSGSDHSKSHIVPSWATGSFNLLRICFNNNILS